MSDIDLTEAVRVFKAAWHAADAHGHEGHRTEIALAAAAPLIARQAERPQEQPPEVQSHRCIAHGTPLCPACARILPEHITQDGECDSCSTWGERGYHWDTCQRRIRGGDVTVSGRDLTEAAEAAARARHEAWRAEAEDTWLPEWDASAAMHRNALREAVLPAVTAAAPLIERQVREQIARDIESYADATWDLVDSNNGARLAFEEIARIARDGAP